MTNLQTSLIVEAYLDRTRLVGLLANVAQNRRLVDILANQDSTLELEWAEARLSGGTEGYRFKSVVLKKSDLLYAIPRETSDQLRARALFRTGMSTQATASMEVGILLRTCHLAGTTLVPPGMNRAKVDSSAFPRFFAVTGAQINHQDGTRTEEPVVIVNRDAIIAVGRPNES
ncbi:MAG: hypothetical protein AB7P33_12570 [Dehalococcoidia bacterium]